MSGPAKAILSIIKEHAVNTETEHERYMNSLVSYVRTVEKVSAEDFYLLVNIALSLVNVEVEVFCSITFMKLSYVKQWQMHSGFPGSNNALHVLPYLFKYVREIILVGHANIGVEINSTNVE
jgi:hypothetical protein